MQLDKSGLLYAAHHDILLAGELLGQLLLVVVEKLRVGDDDEGTIGAEGFENGAGTWRPASV